MTEFLCRIGTPEGAIGERIVAAESAAAARRELSSTGVMVFNVRRRGGSWQRLWGVSQAGAPQEKAALAAAAGVDRAPAGGLRWLRIPWRRRQRLSRADLLVLNQELAALVRAGLPLLRCIDILRGRRSGSLAGGVLNRVRQRLAAGDSLSRAFAAEPQRIGIPSLYVTSLTVGEAGGDLEGALRRYARHLERAQALRRRVKGALLYPVALFVVALAVISVLVSFVLPRFADFYASYNAQLPLLTRVLLAVAGGVRSHGLPVVTVLAALMMMALVGARSEAGRLLRDRWSLKLPLVGHLRHLYLDLEITRTLATLLAGGAPLTQALEVTSRGSANRVYRQRLDRVGELVRQGRNLHEAFEAAGLLDPMGLEMVEVGESTGSLETMLEHVGATYDEVLERRMNVAVGLLEPAVLVSMGIFIAAVLLSLYLPLFNTAQVVG
ncbi:MAG: type II secretion system F family protein [Acidobacteriota bacterium]